LNELHELVLKFSTVVNKKKGKLHANKKTKKTNKRKKKSEHLHSKPTRGEINTDIKSTKKSLTPTPAMKQKKRAQAVKSSKTHPTNMLQTIEKLQSEIGMFDKDGGSDNDKDDDPGLILLTPPTAAGESGDSESGDVESVNENEDNSKWVPVTVNQRVPNNENITSEADGGLLEDNVLMHNRTVDTESGESESEETDNKEVFESGIGEDESEEDEQKSIDALFSLHDEEAVSPRKKGKKSSSARNVSLVSPSKKSNSKMFRSTSGEGKNTHADLQLWLKESIEKTVKMFQEANKEKPPTPVVAANNLATKDVADPNIIKDALQTLVKSKNHTSPDNSPASSNKNSTVVKDSNSNLMLSIPRENYKNLTSSTESGNSDGGKTIILAVPVKLTDKDMVEKQVNAIKEKLLSITSPQNEPELAVTPIESHNISLSDTSAFDNITTSINTTEFVLPNTKKEGSDIDKNSTASPMPTIQMSHLPEEHLKHISGNPVTAIADQPVLDELKEKTAMIEQEVKKENKGFLEAIADLKADELKKKKQKHQAQHKVQSPKVFNTGSLAQKPLVKPPAPGENTQNSKTEYEDDSNESQIAPATTHPTNTKQAVQGQQPLVKPKVEHVNHLAPVPNQAIQQQQQQQQQQPLGGSYFKSKPFQPAYIPNSFTNNKMMTPKDHHVHWRKDGSRCKKSCKRHCTSACRFECCRSQIKKKRIVKAKKKNRKTGEAKRLRKIKKAHKTTIKKRLKAGKIATPTTSSLNLPHLPRITGKIKIGTQQGQKFLLATQARLSSLISMLEKSSDKLVTTKTTCDAQCKRECLPTCKFECCKHEDEK